MADINIKVDARQIVDAQNKIKSFQKTLGDTGSAMKLVNAYKQVESNIQQLSKAQDQGRISGTVYKQGLAEQVALLQSLGHKSTTAQKKVDAFAAAQKKAAQEVKVTNAAVAGSAKGMNRMGVMTQQAGYQIGDFLVQVQSGTNWMVAFGQQATQVAGTMTLLGGKALFIGSALGIAIPLLTAVGAAFMRTSGEAKTTADAFDQVSEAIDKIDDRIEVLDRLGNSVSGVDKAITNLNATLARESIQEAISMAFEDYDENTFWEDFWRRGAKTVPFLDMFTTIADTPEEALEKLGLNVVGPAFIKAFEDDLENLRFDRVRDRIELLVNDIEEVYGSLDKAPPRAQAMVLAMTNAADEAQRLKDEVAFVEFGLANGGVVAEGLAREIGVANAETLAMSGIDVAKPLNDAVQEVIDLADRMGMSVEEAIAFSGVDLASGVDAASASALLLAQRLNWSYQEALKLANFTSDPLNAFGGAGRFIPEDSPSWEEQGRSSSGGGGRGGSRRGGSGGASRIESMEKAYAKLMDRLNGVDPLLTKHREELERLNEWLEKGAISQEEFAAASALLGEELKKNLDPLKDFREELEKALDPEAQYLKGLESLNSALADFLFDPFENGVKGMVLQFAEALRRMASEAIAANIMQKIIGDGSGGGGGGFLSGFGSWFSGIFGSANGNVFSGGGVVPFANGGVVGSPTMFPMKGGKTGLMGEAGPEAIMPLTRKNGKLGVEVSGQSQPATETSIKVINVDDRASIGQYLNSPAGEKVVLNVMRRNGIS